MVHVCIVRKTPGHIVFNLDIMGMYAMGVSELSLKALSAIGTLISSFAVFQNKVSSLRVTLSCYKASHINYWGDGVAQLAEHRLQIQRPEIRTPSGEQEQIVSFFAESKCCADSSVCPTPVCVRLHKNGHVRTLKIL